LDPGPTEHRGHIRRGGGLSAPLTVSVYVLNRVISL
jgi:hypothetical protein